MKALMHINTWANRCGYFFNAALDPDAESCPNNGYNCRHPDCEEVSDGIGCCYAHSCPTIEYVADCEDCDKFGMGCDPEDMASCEDRCGWDPCEYVVAEIPEESFNENYMWREKS